MIFTALSTTIGGIVGKRSKYSDGMEGALKGLVIGFIADAVVWGGTAGIFYGVTSHKNTNNKIAIEQNVAQSAGFAKFTGNAFTVTYEEDKFYTEMFGVAVEKRGGEPTFASVTYEIDKDLYDTINKYVDITYQYGTSGQLIGADYEMRRPDFWLPNAQAAIVENKILKKLVEVTEQKVVSKRTYTKTEATNAAVANVTKGDFAVGAIGYVNTNEKTSTASFTIDLVDVTKDKTATAKRLYVSMPLTAEILADTSKAYDYYVENYDKCTIEEIEVGKAVVYETIQNGQKVIATVDEELTF
ncbi:MAG: hypothetical protein IJA69_01185 [Clostridia bacterium]|nr:hypothetical protein [Clostridia bacterium]